MIDKNKILTRIEKLKKQKDRDNEILTRLDQERNCLIQEVLIRNGRILELGEILRDEDELHFPIPKNIGQI